MTGPPRVTGPLLDVVEVFLQAFDEDVQLHGRAITKATKQSVPVYGVLARLEDASWITGQWFGIGLLAGQEISVSIWSRRGVSRSGKSPEFFIRFSRRDATQSWAMAPSVLSRISANSPCTLWAMSGLRRL